MRAFLIIALLALSGCATASGNMTGGVIENASSMSEAMRKATAHCAQFGKAANPKTNDALFGTMTFDCVETPAK